MKGKIKNQSCLKLMAPETIKKTGRIKNSMESQASRKKFVLNVASGGWVVAKLLMGFPQNSMIVTVVYQLVEVEFNETIVILPEPALSQKMLKNAATPTSRMHTLLGIFHVICIPCEVTSGRLIS